MSDPGNYRSKLEVDEIKKRRDPINLFKLFVLNDGIVCEEEINKIDCEVKLLVSEIMNFSEKSLEPDILTLTKDVFI